MLMPYLNDCRLARHDQAADLVQLARTEPIAGHHDGYFPAGTFAFSSSAQPSTTVSLVTG